MGDLIDFILHIDDALEVLIQQYGTLTYGILFLIIFAETGLVVTPFLPGDSLLFAVGAFAAREGSALNPFLVFVLLSVAAIVGDTVNYMIGAYVGEKVFERNLPFVKREHLDRTVQFYEKYGGKTIILARFVPIVRTFAPFVAGIGKMNYRNFLLFNVIGGIVWVAGFVFLGYLFGNIPFVQHNFELVAVAIVAISLLPIAVEYIRGRRERTAKRVEA
ncbi:MAG TPA: DedA family protein [Roseiflexaceae bacterium]|nr:DedA family protein [Roseiflexaceae bacterium]